jgi:3-methyladenine DNA glycosylase/8-oxoguanine DNA glycosylase
MDSSPPFECPLQSHHPPNLTQTLDLATKDLRNAGHTPQRQETIKAIQDAIGNLNVLDLPGLPPSSCCSIIL